MSEDMELSSSNYNNFGDIVRQGGVDAPDDEVRESSDESFPSRLSDTSFQQISCDDAMTPVPTSPSPFDDPDFFGIAIGVGSEAPVGGADDAGVSFGAGPGSPNMEGLPSADEPVENTYPVERPHIADYNSSGETGEGSDSDETGMDDDTEEPAECEPTNASYQSAVQVQHAFEPQEAIQLAQAPTRPSKELRNVAAKVVFVGLNRGIPVDRLIEELRQRIPNCAHIFTKNFCYRVRSGRTYRRVTGASQQQVGTAEKPKRCRGTRLRKFNSLTNTPGLVRVMTYYRQECMHDLGDALVNRRTRRCCSLRRFGRQSRLAASHSLEFVPSA
jgi:hypothetical protein